VIRFLVILFLFQDKIENQIIALDLLEYWEMS